MHFVSQPPSSHLALSPDDTILCSSIPRSSLIVNEEHAANKVGVAQPTCIVIHEEYEWELEHHHSTKDDSLASEPPLFFPEIFGEPSIDDFAYVSPCTDAPIIDHSQDTRCLSTIRQWRG